MELNNEIVLRPRFKIELNRNNQSVLKIFTELKNSQSDFIVTRVDDHVFIKFPQEKRRFWSPQLHLEINEIDEANSLLYALFGPNPSVWTMFMFLHFLVAGLFIAFGIWAYTNWSLENDYAIQLGLTLLMIIIWFVLYYAGRMGKATGRHEMHQLNNFMNKTLGL